MLQKLLAVVIWVFVPYGLTGESIISVGACVAPLPLPLAPVPQDMGRELSFWASTQVKDHQVHWAGVTSGLQTCLQVVKELGQQNTAGR